MEEQTKTFQKNLELWAKTCPKEAVMLPYVNCSSLLPCTTVHAEPNLKKKGDGVNFTLHSNKGARKEAEDWADGLDLSHVFLLCVYGVGLGYYYDALVPWLKKNRKRHVVFLEDDLAVIHRLLETEKGTQILQDPQVQLVYFKNIENQVFNVLYWNFAMTRLEIASLESYAKHKGEIFTELRHKIAYDAAKNNALVDEYLRFGANFYVNFYQNMLLLGDSYFGNGFFGKFHKVPAIICGAGPSLAKHLPLLKMMHNKALIFAGGSALNALNAADIQPHFGAGLDPNATQAERLASNKAYEVPFFYRNRMHHRAFKLIHGPRLYITGSGGYDTSEFFEKKFKIDAEFMDEGHNVVNFCLQIAKAMGCDPIVFIGMDLAYTGMQTYSSGVVDDTSVKKEIEETTDPDDRPFLKTDIYGKPTYTLWKWVAESDWISEFSKDNPKLTMVNCTEGGLGFSGVPNKKFEEVVKSQLVRSYELSNRIHGETQNNRMPQVTARKIVRAMNELSDSLRRTMGFLEILIDEAQVMLGKLKESKNEIVQSGRSALAETELADEAGYKHVLDMFNEAYGHKLSGDVHDIHVRYRSERARLIRKIPLIIKKHQFLHDVAHVNVELISYALKERKKGNKSEKIKVRRTPGKKGKYTFDKRKIIIEDMEMGLSIEESYNPVLIPDDKRDGIEVAPGYVLRTFFDDSWKIYECYVEKKGKIDGQCLLFYPDGTVKEETFYLNDKLHGPATFYGPEGQVLAKSWFLKGKQEGKSWWYYPSGALYSLQRYKHGVWHGQQEFYYEDGSLKTLMDYNNGRLEEGRRMKAEGRRMKAEGTRMKDEG